MHPCTVRSLRHQNAWWSQAVGLSSHILLNMTEALPWGWLWCNPAERQLFLWEPVRENGEEAVRLWYKPDTKWKREGRKAGWKHPSPLCGPLESPPAKLAVRGVWQPTPPQNGPDSRSLCHGLGPYSWPPHRGWAQGGSFQLCYPMIWAMCAHEENLLGLGPSCCESHVCHGGAVGCPWDAVDPDIAVSSANTWTLLTAWAPGRNQLWLLLDTKVGFPT